MSIAFIVRCAAGPLLLGLIVALWDNYKVQRAGEPISMKLSRGRWRPSGLIINVERAGRWFSLFGLACVGLGIVGAVYGALK